MTENDWASVAATFSPSWKRPLDLFLGSVLLTLCLPLMALIALAIYLEDGRPIFFRQQRVGIRGTQFQIWKYRSMHDGCDQSVHHRAVAGWFSGQSPQRGYRHVRDPRVTRIGRILRMTNLDELPQLVNVLLGEMSIVGPRPAIPYELRHYDQRFERLTLKPGITGLWQVSGRDRCSGNEMLALDLQYARQQSLLLDVKIIALTPLTCLKDAVNGLSH